MNKTHLTILILITISSSVANAQIDYTAQNRFTEVNFFSVEGQDSRTDQANDFAAFNSDLDEQFSVGEAFASGSASQKSELLPTSLTASGSAAGGFGPPVGTSSAGGVSHFETSFTLLSPVQYSLVLKMSDIEEGKIQFTGPSFDIDKQVGFFSPEFFVDLTIDGVAYPGDYSMLIDLTSGAITQGDYDIRFDVTALAIGDSNLDGIFNSGDLTAVFQRSHYEDGLAQNSQWADGDWNGDLEFDSGDLVYAFREGAYSRAAHAVPEPATSLMLQIAVLLVANRRRRAIKRLSP